MNEPNHQPIHQHANQHNPAPIHRLHRQSLLPDFGPQSPEKLAAAHALILGLGALGSVAADLLARAGVGTLSIIDRDTVEQHNLHRQTLYTNHHAENETPKAEAARRALAAANPDITIHAHAEDLTPHNAARLCKLNPNAITSAPNVIIDATDNFNARLILNDCAVKHTIPMVYAGAIATRAMLMTILPIPHPTTHPTPPWADPNNPHAGAGPGPCLRCILDRPPQPGHTETCDTTGVLGTVSAAAAAFQATEALKVILGRFDKLRRHLLAFDPWNTEFNRIDASPHARDPQCPCCAHRRFEFLDNTNPQPAETLCGRDAVQLTTNTPHDLQRIAHNLAPHATVRAADTALRILPNGEHHSITLFADGRAIVRGTEDPARARAIYHRYIGA